MQILFVSLFEVQKPKQIQATLLEVVKMVAIKVCNLVKRESIIRYLLIHQCQKTSTEHPKKNVSCEPLRLKREMQI